MHRSLITSAELRMFRKFDEKESISAVSQLKTSVQKGIRNQVRILVLKWGASKGCRVEEVNI